MVHFDRKGYFTGAINDRNRLLILIRFWFVVCLYLQSLISLLQCGTEDVKRHRWFKHIDWADVFMKKLQVCIYLNQNVILTCRNITAHWERSSDNIIPIFVNHSNVPSATELDSLSPWNFYWRLFSKYTFSISSHLSYQLYHTRAILPTSMNTLRPTGNQYELWIQRNWNYLPTFDCHVVNLKEM